jgi:hypothetical protein
MLEYIHQARSRHYRTSPESLKTTVMHRLYWCSRSWWGFVGRTVGIILFIYLLHFVFVNSIQCQQVRGPSNIHFALRLEQNLKQRAKAEAARARLDNVNRDGGTFKVKPTWWCYTPGSRQMSESVL